MHTQVIYPFEASLENPVSLGGANLTITLRLVSLPTLHPEALGKLAKDPPEPAIEIDCLLQPLRVSISVPPALNHYP